MKIDQHVCQARIFFAGIVQGVGFRYNAQHFAVQLGLKGWVKNLPDGRVEACVHGPQDKIEHLCQRLKSHYDGSVSSVDIVFSPVEGAFEGFRILR